ncbi:Putative ribonuclease H protein At1g65750 [Linum perenne]
MNLADDSGRVNHIFYADDSLVFCDASKEQVRFLAAICFECVSGLKINFHKSVVYPVGEVIELESLAGIFGCPIASFPTTYLGLPLRIKSSSINLWDPVIASLDKRLGTWKARFLPFGGRLVIIKSVLSALSVYYLSLFRAPCSVISTLERIQCRFLWFGVADVERIHWINWHLVKTPRKLGGLEVSYLMTLNTALLSKWHWRFAIERSAWWRMLIVQKCGVGPSDWRPFWQFRTAGLSVWNWLIPYSLTFWTYGSIDLGVRVRFGSTFGLRGWIW